MQNVSHEEAFLIVGLGNPGKEYENTRHNIGFKVVKEFARKNAIELRPSMMRVRGSIGHKKEQERVIYLLLPLTYMNESGVSIKRCLNYYRIPLHHMMVVADDVALPFGKLRMRSKGSCGGHNGLKSIEMHLATQEYARLRIGVGQPPFSLAQYVLEEFAPEEQKELPEKIQEATEALDLWLVKGAEAAMKEVNK